MAATKSSLRIFRETSTRLNIRELFAIAVSAGVVGFNWTLHAAMRRRISFHTTHRPVALGQNRTNSCDFGLSNGPIREQQIFRFATVSFTAERFQQKAQDNSARWADVILPILSDKKSRGLPENCFSCVAWTLKANDDVKERNVEFASQFVPVKPAVSFN